MNGTNTLIFDDVRLVDEHGDPLTMASFVEVDFGAVSYKEIFQNIKMILTTPLFSVPLDRLFGLDVNLVDTPINVAAHYLVPEILAKIQRYERRAVVLDIQFEGNPLEGHLIPIIQLRIDNETYRDRAPYLVPYVFEPRDEFPLLPRQTAKPPELLWR